MNNVYGWAMSEYLPYGEFDWLKNFDGFDAISISGKKEKGYFLEVEVEYPDELHELHKKLACSSDMLPKHCKEIAEKYGINVGDVKKIIPNLGHKTKYVLHYRNLQLYLYLGMKLTKIYRLLKFKQSDWMKNILILTLKKEKKCS